MEEVALPRRGEQLTDDGAMSVAIQVAKKGAGFVSPNPLVGCVVLDKENRFLSWGYHERYGEAHAEVQALKGLNERDLVGARLFVTLEPCAHQGKTPSCALALAKLPISEVIYGLVDPNPLVSGKGAEILRSAGIATKLFGRMTAELEEVCEHFLTNQKFQRPFVSLKVASSLDGQMALVSGESKWITCEKSREYAHYLRGSHDATLVGRGTVLTDNPQLSIRHPSFALKKNRILVLDDTGSIQHKRDLRLFHANPAENVTIFSGEEGQLGRTDLGRVLKKSWELGIRSILVEGGVEVISSFLNSGLVDRVYVFVAPKILGSRGGRSWTSDVQIDQIKDALNLRTQRFLRMDQDILVTGLLVK